MSRIETTFWNLRNQGKAALMPYVTMGFPRLESALQIVPAIVAAGADLVELGAPFSDPLADGATIQAASHRALENGMTLAHCLEQAATLRSLGIEAPFVLMGYYNPILQMGTARFARLAADAGIDGVIVADLPPEESEELRSVLRTEGLDMIFLLPPTADAERIQHVVECTSGFLYLVSLTGVTGARKELAPDLEDFVRRVRPAARPSAMPLAVGFGIGTPEQAARVASLADGVIVGSALVRVIGASNEPASAAQTFVARLRSAIDAT